MATLSPRFIDIRDSYPPDFDALISARRTSQLAHDDAVRERILDAATELFDQQGYISTSVRQIAAQLGCPSAILYNHFAHKEDILYSIVVRTRVELFDHECLHSPVGLDPADAVVEVLRRMVDFVVDHPAAVSVSILSHPHLSPGRRTLLESARRHRLNWFADIIAHGQRGEREPLNRHPLLLASMVRAYINSLAQFVLPASDFPEGDVGDLSLNACLSIVRLHRIDDDRR